MAEANPGASFAPNAYANAFVRGKPRDSANVVQQRLRKAKAFNDELADYFAARRELEETYLKQLQKISKRSFLSDASSIPPGFAPVYERLIQELAEVAAVHSEFEKRVADECEDVVRNASAKGEWSRVKDHDDSLANTLREINSLESQLQKDQKKLEGASAKKAGQANAKVQETERALSQTLEIWETEAPFAFEAYQRIDAQRLELLKEVVAKFETAQSDAAQRLMSIAEKTMQDCLGFDTQADMQDFILKNGSTGATLGSRNGTGTRPTTATGSGSAAPGLNRQGSIAGRSVSSRTSGAAAAASTATATAAAGRSNGMGTGEFGRSTTSIQSGDRTMSSIRESNTSKSGGSTLKNAFSRFGRGRSNKDASNTQTVYGALPDKATGGDSSFSSSGGAGASASRTRDSTVRQSVLPSGSASTGLGAVGEDSIDSLGPSSGAGLMAPLTPSVVPAKKNSSSVPQSPVQASSSAAPQVDAEGYSIPPPDRKPWETGAAGAATGSSSLMDDDADDSRDTFDNSLTSRVTSMNISNQPIMEDSAKDKAALERMKSTLLTSGPPQRRGTTRRDRRDVRNTTYNPAFAGVGAGDDSRLSQFGVVSASPVASTPGSPSPFGNPSTFTGQAGVGRHRTQSIASVSSSTNPFENSTSTAPIKASLNERVNVIFTGRDISKVMVVGELSVSVAQTLVGLTEPLHVRVEAFEQLEKAAPNPVFLRPVPQGNVPGEYLLDVKALLEQGATSGVPGSPAQAVVLKYQLHISDSRKDLYVPLHLHAQWRCEPHQTSFLMTYAANPACKLHEGAARGDATASTSTPTTIQDLQVAVQIAPSTVTNIMSKPTATFSADNKSLFWKLNDSLPLSSPLAEPPSKLLARCQISGQQTTPSPVYLRWKIRDRTISSLSLSTIPSSNNPADTADPTTSLKFDEIVRSCTAGKFIASP
ncbi:hypothetical protein BCV70DRAFT_198949 [Testicularia cyperi]|uniref:MHD domain-containing protein n=1 Tax=Testicularia cyperi TaxID=1882483 RepID=A0A317XUC5_9BASI|nr:hypothetical protein BCV70DRAFT_198949 [Testicularia cyperi]